ncbi:hypothetical protein DM860_005570 [Cuscuta australis]|uniref:VQ domain-containing protein n=1 Tax=Cuscuta australis TaxID=267555 RepID=A0A328DRW7_9ASTE|nr:hypothetical protein DM860_005570 [Cuscuta australis]
MDMTPPPPEGKSPRREIQGPRPAPLKVRKESQKIRKPPLPSSAPPPPLIIYTVSPKVFHANPNEFMSLVQRLTGPPPPSLASISSSPFGGCGGAVSPAACFASAAARTRQGERRDVAATVGEGVGIVGGEVERSGYFPGVLSPNPASLPPIPSGLFAQPSDHQTPIGAFLTDLISPPVLLPGTRNYPDGGVFTPSPSFLNNFISPRFILSPGTPSFDLFNNLLDP